MTSVQVYPSISQQATEDKALLKLQSENLFNKLDQLQKELKHYHKLKHKWNIFKNILHYSKYPLAIILGALDVGLIFTGIGIPLAIIGASVTIGEVIGTNILEDTIVNIKVAKYHNKTIHIIEWIDKMYLFKQDILKDNNIDAKEIMQWKEMLQDYEQSKNSLVTDDSKNGQQQISLKTIQEQLNIFLMEKRK